MAHRGYIAGRPATRLDVVDVPASEKQPAAGAFALARSNAALRQKVDRCLNELLGCPWHREMMREYGFSDSDIDRLL